MIHFFRIYICPCNTTLCLISWDPLYDGQHHLTLSRVVGLSHSICTWFSKSCWWEIWILQFRSGLRDEGRRIFVLTQWRDWSFLGCFFSNARFHPLSLVLPTQYSFCQKGPIPLSLSLWCTFESKAKAFQSST